MDDRTKPRIFVAYGLVPPTWWTKIRFFYSFKAPSLDRNSVYQVEKFSGSASVRSEDLVLELGGNVYEVWQHGATMIKIT